MSKRGGEGRGGRRGEEEALMEAGGRSEHSDWQESRRTGVSGDGRW